MPPASSAKENSRVYLPPIFLGCLSTAKINAKLQMALGLYYAQCTTLVPWRSINALRGHVITLNKLRETRNYYTFSIMMLLPAYSNQEHKMTVQLECGSNFVVTLDIIIVLSMVNHIRDMKFWFQHVFKEQRLNSLAQVESTVCTEVIHYHTVITAPLHTDHSSSRRRGSIQNSRKWNY